jgi:hypothetical protein
MARSALGASPRERGRPASPTAPRRLPAATSKERGERRKQPERCHAPWTGDDAAVARAGLAGRGQPPAGARAERLAARACRARRRPRAARFDAAVASSRAAAVDAPIGRRRRKGRVVIRGRHGVGERGAAQRGPAAPPGLRLHVVLHVAAERDRGELEAPVGVRLDGGAVEGSPERGPAAPRAARRLLPGVPEGEVASQGERLEAAVGVAPDRGARRDPAETKTEVPFVKTRCRSATALSALLAPRLQTSIVFAGSAEPTHEPSWAFQS